MIFLQPDENDKRNADMIFEDLCISFYIYKDEGYEIISAIEKYQENPKDKDAFNNLLKAAIAYGIFSQRIKNA